MSHDHLNAGAQLAFVPGFAFLRRHLGREHRYPDSFFRQDAFQPPCHISLLRVNGIHLYISSAVERSLNFFQQSPFLGVDEVLIQVSRRRDQERFAPPGFGIELTPHQVSESVGFFFEAPQQRLEDQSCRGHRLVAFRAPRLELRSSTGRGEEVSELQKCEVAEIGA